MYTMILQVYNYIFKALRHNSSLKSNCGRKDPNNDNSNYASLEDWWWVSLIKDEEEEERRKRSRERKTKRRRTTLRHIDLELNESRLEV